MNLIPGVDIRPVAATLANQEYAQVQEFLKNDDLSKTFYAHGTEMLGMGKDIAMNGRTEWEKLPVIEDACDKLEARIKAEIRQ